MARIAIACVVLTLCSTLLAGAAFAQYQAPAPQQQQPAPQPAQTSPQPAPAQPSTPAPAQITTGPFADVSNLKPFSAEADFMSLPGYLRYLTFQQTGEWITYQEAARIVQQQRGI